LAACVVAAGEAGQRVASVAAIGSAAFFGRQQEYLSARLLLLLRLMRPQLPARLLSPLLGRFDLPLLRPLQNLENVDSAVYRRALLNALEQSASREIQQLADWIELDSFRALEEGPDYRESLARLRAPVMFLAAPRDRLAPPSMVQATCDACDGADTREVVFATRSGGFSCNYGHLDMLIGRNVGRDVVPALVGWVERWDGDDGEGG